MSGFKPDEIWGMQVQKPGTTSQVGCVPCLLTENTTAPEDPIYYLQGTSYCRRHLLLQYGAPNAE